MKALLYLWGTTVKNQIKALKKQPGILVLYIFVIAMLFFTIFTSYQIPAEEVAISSGDVLGRFGALSFLIMLAFFSFTSWSGLNQGGAFFSLSDVHLLFPTPISPKKVMLYGIIKRMGLIFLFGLIMLFQTATIRQFVGVSVFGVIAIYISMIITMLIGQMAALSIYQFVQGNNIKKIIIKAIYVLVFGALALSITANLKSGTVNAFITVLDSDYASYVPIVGWAKGLSMGIYTLNVAQIVIFGALLVISAVLLTLSFIKGKADYYEDVIGAAELHAAAKAMQKAEGNNLNALSLGKKVKVRDTGLGAGHGASAIFFRHMREIRRKKLYFIDIVTVMTGGFGIFFSYLISQEGSSTQALMAAFAMSVYMYLFFNMTGMWAKELQKPFIFLIPESSFKKLIWATMSSLIKSLVDGIVIFAALGYNLKAPIWQVAVLAIAFATSGWVYVAGDILCQRIFKRQIGNGILRFFYFIILGALLVPGVVASIIVGIILGGNEFPILAISCMSIWNVIAYALILFICRNLLSNMDT